MKFIALPSASAKGVCWIVRVPQAGTGSKVREHYQIRHNNTSILKKFLDVTKLVIGNKVASFTNLYQCLQELSICISYMALKGINTPSLYIDQQNTTNKYFTITITGLGNPTIKSLITSKSFPRRRRPRPLFFFTFC